MPILAPLVALASVVAVAARPRARASALAAVAGAGLLVAAGAVTPAAAAGALRAVLPAAILVAAALALAEAVRRSGLAERLAGLLAWAARGRGGRLYALVCVLCALLTASLSLDAAVVVMVPVLLALGELGAAPAPLLLATVGVANASSLALPQGNPTNLVLMAHLGMGPGAFAARMLAPAALATLVVAALPPLRGGALGRLPRVPRPRRPWSGAERRAGLGVAAAAAAGWIAPALGASPWWPLALVALVAVGAEAAAARALPRPPLPWALGLELWGLLVSLGAALPALGIAGGSVRATSLLGLLAVTGAVTALAALANNLPASAAVAGALSAWPPGGAALVGLSVGALVTPHGSVATLLAHDAAGPGAAPTLLQHVRSMAPAALAAALVATLWIWLASAGGVTWPFEIAIRR
jgi:arsenical pump membrane protein